MSVTRRQILAFLAGATFLAAGCASVSEGTRPLTAEPFYGKWAGTWRSDTNPAASAQGADVERDILTAVIYYIHGEYAEAEKLFKRSLAIREKALGPNHPDVATSLDIMASIYAIWGDYAKAEPLYKRSLAIREKALGPNHPDVAKSLNSMAIFYGIQGEYAKAEPLFKRSLAIREKALGHDHPDVATSLENLAALYRTSKRNVEAEALEQRAAKIRAIER
jgi:tetratricopeptide (TPR) repeat protein